MELKVLRTSGARGTVIVPYRTVEGLAKGGGEDFEDTYGELEFKNDETCKVIHVKIIDDEEYEKNKNFFLELGEPRMALPLCRVEEAGDLPVEDPVGHPEKGGNPLEGAGGVSTSCRWIKRPFAGSTTTQPAFAESGSSEAEAET
ncbi:hypothetical protein fugu_016950 [Takifugu bimaculatus]|uniref:Calx-beta domain-containing protein n=1 Tax=Takifugu bimaculatus TaxID=433685 RepID=A0A4Z2BVI3_9TELE|nr:hypothetical protein fugu_016950 [Takifugu bimaculatus]